MRPMVLLLRFYPVRLLLLHTQQIRAASAANAGAAGLMCRGAAVRRGGLLKPLSEVESCGLKCVERRRRETLARCLAPSLFPPFFYSTLLTLGSALDQTHCITALPHHLQLAPNVRQSIDLHCLFASSSSSSSVGSGSTSSRSSSSSSSSSTQNRETPVFRHRPAPTPPPSLQQLAHRNRIRSRQFAEKV